MLSLLLATAIAFGIMHPDEGNEFIYSQETVTTVFILVFLFSFIALAIPVFLFVSLVFGIQELISRIPKPRRKYEDSSNDGRDNIVKTLYHSAKDKLCSKIEWID